MNKKIMAFYTILVLLMIVPQASATEYSVSLSLDTDYIRAGPCSGGTMIKGTIENTGELTDTFTISPQDSWIITTPQKVTLNAGESKGIAIFMTPPCDTESGEYKIDITAESENSKDTETLTIDVLSVHSVELETSITKTGCIGDTETFTLDISNLGKTDETFIITSTAGILEEDEITLESGESKKISLDIPVTTDKKTVDVEVKSKTSYAQDSETLRILGVNCYSQEIRITPESKTMCITESSDFTLTIKNTGTKQDTYTITTDMGELSTDALTIEPDTEKKVKLTVTPQDMGKYTANIEVKSTGETKKASVQVTAQNCKGIAVITIPKEKTVCKENTAEYTVTVKNIGKTEDTIKLSSTMGELSEKEITLEAGKTREMQLAIQTDTLDYGTYTVTVTAESEIRDTSESYLTVENCYSATLSTEPQIIKVCPGIDAVFTVTLKNTGKNKDTYNLETSDGTLEQDVVELESLESKEILLTVPTEREDKNIVINTFSQHTQQTTELNISLKDEEKCYGFTINANPEIIEAQEYKGYMYILTVKNTGEYASNFSISTIGGPEWVFIDPTAINIMQDTEDRFHIYVSPPYGTETGTHNIDIEIKRDDTSSKTVTLKLILSKIGTPEEQPSEPEEEKEEEKEAPRTYTLTIDAEKTYEINENQTEEIGMAYEKDGEETQVNIRFRTGSFVIEIDDALIEDDSPEIGENIYELTTDTRQYTVVIEFTEVNATSNTYQFKIKSAQVTELPEEQITTPTGEATEERAPISKNLIYATIIGLVIIILILFGPEIAEKTKNFFTEEAEEKEEEQEPKPKKEEVEKDIPLEEIKGIGGKRAEALRKSGISNVKQLAEANITDIMAEAVTSEKQAKDLIKKAQAIVKKKSKKEEDKTNNKKPKPRKEVKDDIKDILESI